MLAGIRGAPMLDAIRGSPPADQAFDTAYVLALRSILDRLDSYMDGPRANLEREIREKLAELGE